jgi:hypothetical protein
MKRSWWLRRCERVSDEQQEREQEGVKESVRGRCGEDAGLQYGSGGKRQRGVDDRVVARVPQGLREMARLRQLRSEAEAIQWRRVRARVRLQGETVVEVWFRERVRGALLSTGAVRVGRVRVCVWECDEWWLGVELTVEGVDMVGWVRAGELVGLVGADVVMAAALRGEDRVGWDVWGQCWTEWVGSGVRGRSSVRGVGGWYVPVEVIDEEMAVGSGTVVSVRVRLVAIGLDAGRYRGAAPLHPKHLPPLPPSHRHRSPIPTCI